MLLLYFFIKIYLPAELIISVKHARIPLNTIIRFEEEKKSKIPAFIKEMFECDKLKRIWDRR